jgi:hypothetical protein
MWHIKLGEALGIFALSGLMGVGVGVGYCLVKVSESEKDR